MDSLSKVSAAASRYSARSSFSVAFTSAVGPVTLKTLPRLAISTPSRNSIWRKCASNGPARLANCSGLLGSRTNSRLSETVMEGSMPGLVVGVFDAPLVEYIGLVVDERLVEMFGFGRFLALDQPGLLLHARHLPAGLA